ncbi:MAG: aminotransferase class I/II-fold pyridoxal phosphate-dependent enzyme, partial [Proteobacteria bacterium]
IDGNAHGVCFVVDGEGKLAGGITDGDVRRALLAGKGLNASAQDVMVANFFSLPADSSSALIQNNLSERIRVIPLLNPEGIPVDFATRSRYHRISVLEPNLKGNELAYVTDCIQTNWISSQGSYVRRFEEDLRNYAGANYALAVSNGTVALHLALKALGIGPGDEVIVPSLTFAASANAVIHAGATPVFADVEAETWTIDVAAARKLIGPRTKAIMPVHLYGHPCRMDELQDLVNSHDIQLVEDCAESLGSLYKGRQTGSFGAAACFSFFGNKTITTGEGGMVLFRDLSCFEMGAVLRDHGMSKKERYWHDVVGFNYRLTNMQAAIGVAQMERVDQ